MQQTSCPCTFDLRNQLLLSCQTLVGPTSAQHRLRGLEKSTNWWMKGWMKGWQRHFQCLLQLTYMYTYLQPEMATTQRGGCHPLMSVTQTHLLFLPFALILLRFRLAHCMQSTAQPPSRWRTQLAPRLWGFWEQVYEEGLLLHAWIGHTHAWCTYTQSHTHT